MSSNISARNRERLGRLAASCAIAVIGTVSLENACNHFPVVIVWWLLYTIACGLVLNTRRGESLTALLFLAIAPTATPIMTELVLLLSGQDNLCISIHLPDDPLKRVAIVILIPTVTWAAIVIFSFGNGPAKAAARWVQKLTPKGNVEEIGSVIRAIVSVVIAIVLALSRLGAQ